MNGTAGEVVEVAVVGMGFGGIATALRLNKVSE